jgi:hypothetical protein
MRSHIKEISDTRSSRHLLILDLADTANDDLRSFDYGIFVEQHGIGAIRRKNVKTSVSAKDEASRLIHLLGLVAGGSL